MWKSALFAKGERFFASRDFIFLDELAAHAACLFRKYQTESAFALHSIWPGISLAWTVNNFFSPTKSKCPPRGKMKRRVYLQRGKGIAVFASATLLLLGIRPK
jgi:hypothetical protein